MTRRGTCGQWTGGRGGGSSEGSGKENSMWPLVECVSNGENFTFRVRGRVVTGLRLARGSSACNAAVNALHRSYAKDFVRQVGQQSRVLFDFRQCNVRVDISGEKCTCVRTGAVCFVNMCSSGSMAPQCQEFGPKAGGANIVVRPQLCAGMPNVGETLFDVRSRKRH